MKTFQKIALVSAIAAAPFAAQAELVSMDDALMGNTTGQAGVTIEINIEDEITIGSVTYTDTEGAAGTNGSVVLERIAIGNVTDLKQTIDVNGDGDLIMGMSAVDNVTVGMGVDLTDIAGTMNKSAVMLQGSDDSQAELVNNLSLQVDLGASTTTIHNLAGGSGTGTLADANVQGSHSTDLSAMAIQMTQKVRLDSLEVGLFGYTSAQATGGVATAAAAEYKAGFDQLVLDGVDTTDYVAANAADANGDGEIAGAEVAVYTAGVASGAAIKISGVEFYKDNSATPGGLAKDYATIKQTIWAKGGSSLHGGGVYIQIEEIAGTLDIGSIEIGGSSIGSVQIADLNLAGLTQRIYGH